ncbi:MAG: hypothetical protein HYZ14_06605 [Bacteroidetes bacterium]|nr:hypothetical protein [Bacteroidota bacterium]
MKKRLFYVVLLTYCLPSAAQDDMDDIFDDGVSNSHVAVGTDLVTDFSGTINLYANLKPADFFRAQLGIGFMPLGSYTDFMNLPRREDLPIKDTLISGGFYYALGAHLVRETSLAGFDYFYYLDFKHWSYTAQSMYDMKRYKACFGMGYAYQVAGGLSFDMHLGVYMGHEKVTANEDFSTSSEAFYHGMYFSEVGDIGKTFLNGFDFGIGVNYNFNL